MALPAGIITVLVRFGPMLDDFGAPYSGLVTFASSGPRVWEATGTPILPRPLAIDLDVDGRGQVELPATDQPGFTDGAGNSVKDWTYRAGVALEGRNATSVHFQLPTDGATDVEVDLDLMTPVTSSKGVTVALPSVLSVAGITGAVSAEALADALESVLPTPETGPRYDVPTARVIFDGDSITLGPTTNNVSGSGNQDRAKAWPSYAEQAADGRIDYIYNAAVGGQTSPAMLARFDTIVAPRTPTVVVASIGANNLGQDLPMQGWLDDLEAYRLKCVGIGATLIVGSIFPTQPSIPQADAATWNAALREWAAEKGVRVIPFDALTDPVTGGWPAGWSADNIHPTLLDAPQQIGVFAWEAIADLFGAQVLGTGRRFGAGALDNGLFEISTNQAAPTATAVALTGTGTLPAGTYSYRVSSRTYIGESALSAPVQATLASGGQITVGGSVITNNRGYRVYRRGSADFDWKLVATVAAGGGLPLSWVDNGSATPGEVATGVDTSWQPGSASLVNLSNARVGGGLLYDTAVRGRVLRLRTREDTGGEFGYLLTGAASVTGSTAEGDVWDFTCLVRGDGRNPGKVRLRLRSGTTQVALIVAHDDMPLPGGRWGRVHLRFRIPAGVNNCLPLLTVSPKTGTDEGYADFGEVRLVKVS